MTITAAMVALILVETLSAIAIGVSTIAMIATMGE